MKTIRPAVTAVMLVLVLSPSLARAASFSKPSAAYDWLDISLEATAREVDRHGARPTIISRTLAIALTAMYDAWAAYDEKAVGTRLGAALRRPAAERTVANKETAIAYATYRALVDVYPEDKAWIDSQMRGKRFDPDDASVDPATPQGIGNLAAKAVCAYRHHDGANQFGDEVGSNGVPYSYYAPVNTAEQVNDPNRWQPIPFVNPKRGFVTPGFLTPHWHRVKPFALDRSDQFRAPVPPRVDSEQLRKETDENIAMNAGLTEGGAADQLRRRVEAADVQRHRGAGRDFARAGRLSHPGRQRRRLSPRGSVLI